MSRLHLKSYNCFSIQNINMRVLILSSLIITATLTSCEESATTNVQTEQQQQEQQQQEQQQQTSTEDSTRTQDEDTTTVETKPNEIVEAKSTQPIMDFDSKSFDYGTVAQGDKVTHTFRFTNSGDADLIIKKAEASCGCTMPSYPFVPIKPGETGTISVTFNTTGKLGKQRPNISVISNAYPRTQTLYLEGYVADKIAETSSDLIEQGLNINPEDNVTKGGKPAVEIKEATDTSKNAGDN